MTTENENTTDEIKNLDVNTVYPNPDQPRKAFDEASLKELADSITKHGVIQPVTVVKTDKGYMIVAGERRYRATLKAGLKTVPAAVRRLLQDGLLRAKEPTDARCSLWRSGFCRAVRRLRPAVRRIRP